MKSSTLLPVSEGLRIESLSAEATGIVIRIATIKEAVACPSCGHSSNYIHSRYQRTLADLPWNQVAVRIYLLVRKFFCTHSARTRRIFAELLPELAARYARKTVRLQEAFYLIGYALGGRAGAQVAVELGLAASPDTLLRRVRQVAEEQYTPPTDLRIVGVDDWAFRKGHRYGTILIDLQRRRMVDLLPDRSSDSLAVWLKQNASIEVISRDRAGVYADGARQEAFQAQQVADRWHLLLNVGDAMERLTAQHTVHLRQAADVWSCQL